MKVLEKLQSLLPLGIILIAICLGLEFSNTGSVYFCGFGADSNGRVYVGRFHTIEIYDNGGKIGEIQSPLNKGWFFTVTRDNHILVTNGYYLYTLDLDGTVVEIGEDHNSNLLNRIRKTKSITDIHGNEYKLNSVLGFKWIIKNNKTIYHTPFLDVIAKSSAVVGCSSFLIGMIGLTVCKKKDDLSIGLPKEL